MNKVERRGRLEADALGCLKRNGVKVRTVTKDGKVGCKQIIKSPKPIGLKVWAAIDCLKNWCGYSEVGR